MNADLIEVIEYIEFFYFTLALLDVKLTQHKHLYYAKQ